MYLLAGPKRRLDKNTMWNASFIHNSLKETILISVDTATEDSSFGINSSPTSFIFNLIFEIRSENDILFFFIYLLVSDTAIKMNTIKPIMWTEWSNRKSNIYPPY